MNKNCVSMYDVSKESTRNAFTRDSSFGVIIWGIAFIGIAFLGIAFPRNVKKIASVRFESEAMLGAP